MQDFLTAQAQRRSVYLADRRLMVNTTLTRAKDIRFAVDMELDKQSRDNYFALTQMDRSVPDMTRGILGQAAKGVAGTGTDLFLTMQRLTAAGLSSAGRYVQKQRELSAASADLLAGRTTAAQTNERYQQIEAKYNELTRLGRNALDIMKQNHQAFMERAGLAKDEKDGFVYDFASGLTTLGAGVGATMASGNPAAASVLFAMYAGRQDYEEALENGITPGRAMAIGFAGGTMEGALEHLGLSGLEKIFKGKGILRAGLKGFITEATQEGSQQTAEEFIMQHFGGREKSFEDTFVDIVYSALLGGLTGAPISMVMNFAQRKFEEEGLKLPAAKAFARLAVESATSQAAQKMAHDTLRDVTSPLNYPNADPVQAAQEFGKLVKTEPDRAIMRKIYNVAERMEEKALNAGFDEPTAQLLGKIEQSRANSIYNLAGIKPGSQADMAEVQFLPAAKPVDDWETQRKQHQQRQAQQRAQEEAEFDRKLAEANLTDKDLLFQSAAAMYRNPARSLAEFKDFSQENQKNPKEKNKSFYAFDAGGVEVHVPFERAIHIDNGHQLTDQQLSAVEKELGIFEYAVQMPGVGEYNGKQVKFKGNTSQGKIGGVLEISQNGRVFLDTVFFGTDADIDNWAKENPSNAPSKKPVFISRGTISIADIVDKIKGPKTDNNTLWQEGENLFAPSQTSLNTYKEDLKKAQAGTLKTGQLIRIGRIGLYERLGFAEKPFGLSVNVLKKITEGKHNVKIQDIENLPQLIADPVAVFKSRTDQNSLVAVVSAKDNSNRQVITILRDTQGKINVIPSMYGKDNFNSFVASNIKEGNLIYIDEEKALKTIRPQELQLLKEDSLKGSIYNIRRKENFVNTWPDNYTLLQEGKNLFAPDETVARKFKADVKAVLSDKNTPNNTKVDMGVIPPLYEKLGLPKQELKTNKLALRKALGLLTQEELKADKNLHNHNVPQEVVENLPKLLADPVAVFRSNTKPGAYVAVLNEKAGKDQIVAILRPSPKENGFTFIPTVYEHGKFDKFVESTVRKNNVVYIDKNRMSLPEPLIQAGTIGKNILTNSIRTKEDFVNTLPDTNTLWQGGLFDNQLELFGSQAEQEDAPSPAQEDLGVEVNSLFTQEELEADLPPFKPTEKPARIEDFGEKILGARKDVWGKYKHALEEEIPSTAENVTLGKFFPEPNYDAAIRQGITADTLAAVKALRDSIPAKPQRSYRQGQWLETLKYVRALSLQLLNGQLSTQQLQQMLQQGGRAVSSLTETISFYQDLGYPLFTKARGYTMHVQNYLVYNGHRFAEPTPIYEFKRGWRSVYGSPSKEETLAFARKFFTEKAVKGAAPTKLDLYQKVRTGEIVIGKKIASGKYIDLKGGFTKVADAQKYLEENQAHLEALLEAKRKMPDVRRKINEERIGKVYRPAGTVVTPERFMQEFGFRGVQFGNWVEQERRAQDLNNAYDALLDMANLLHIPSRAVSLDGQLGLAFGARGIPGAAAHYEHKQVVINLTKTQGAGSLGHEWWHALDNYFGKTSGQDAMQTVNPSSALRPEMKAAFEEVVRVTKAVLGERSRAVDSLRSKNYWSTNSEMTARAFESYLVYKAKQLGFRNDYLANIVHPDAFLRFGQDKYPYPFDNEMPVLAAAFDNFFNTIKTRESQKGYTLYQEDADISFDFGANVSPAGARGSVSFDPQSNTAIIRAVSADDKSTVIHELYHVWRRDLKRAEQVSSESDFLELMQRLRDIDANSQDYVLRYISRTSLLTPSQRQIMLQTIQQRGGKKYIEALARQDELDAQDAVAMFVRRGFEENFAVLAEKYFMKGVAPSAAYKSLFDRFAQWLKEIYNAIGQEVDLAPEVQDFFDRLMVQEASQVDSKLFKGKVAQLKRLVTNIRQGNAQEVDGLGIQDLKALLAQLDAPRPKAVTQHLLKDLRRFGAEYANAANIDKEAYKQARVFNKAGGVDDRPDVWLQKHGYMEFEESTEETLAAAWDMLQRALDGEIIYPQGYEEQAAQWANYKTNIDTLREVFGGSEKEARKTAQAILDLEEQGYRVVEQKDLANVSLRLAELDRLAERLENKSQTTQDKEQADKDILRAAQKIKNALVKDLNKRQVEGKGEMVKRLAAAKTFKEITQAVQNTLDFLNAAWAKTPQAQQEQRRLEVPATNWDKVRRDLLAQYTRIVNSAGEDVNNAYKKVAELSKLITAGQALTDEQATALRKARQTIKNASGKMEARYVGAMESTLRQIIHITPQDARNFAARYGKNAMRFKALNEAQLDLFIKEAQATQQKNYKRYMRGKLSALFNRKAYEKLGSVRRAKYTPYMLEFLEKASQIWGGSQQEALQQYEAAVESIDPDNPPSVFQALINRVLWIKADPGGEVTMQDLHAFYEDALAAVRGDAAQKRLDGERRAVQEANIRLAACLSLKERKLPKGIVTYLLHGGVDLQTFIDIAFGQYETDMYESDPLPSRAEQSLAALKKIAAGSEEETVPGLRPDFVQYGGTPDVTFIWGDNNKGLQHIAQKHGADILPQVIDTVVAGRVERFTASKKTLVLQKGNIEAVLSLDEHGKQKTWLLTGWDATSPKGNKKRTDANGQVSTGSAATQTLPTFSRQDLGAVLNNSIAQKEPVNKGLKKHKINFREELAPETNQIKEAVFNAQINKDILRAVGTAYQLKTSQQILDKIAEMQKDTMQLTNYAYVKDQANGEVIATLFKNGKPVTYNAPRVQTINRLEALTFWIWNQNHDFVDTAHGTEDFGLSGRLHYAYGQDQLKNLFDWLTPQDLQAAKNLQKLVEKHYEQESQVHQRIYGFKLPKVEFYFPSVTERVTDSIDLKQEFVQNSKSPSFIKKRVQSQRVIQRIVNPIDLVLKHLRRAGEFIFEAENYAANKRIFKDRDVESAFLEKFGQQDGKKLYSKFMTLLDQQAPQKAQVKDEFYSVMNKLFNGWVKAVMGLKPITGIKQFASSISFAENMPWGLWAKWFAEALANPRKTADFMLKASPYIQARYEMGGMNEYTARAMASDEVAPIKSRWNTFTNFMLINTRLGDKASLIFGGYPYMKYLLEVEGLSQQEAARVFEKQATRTLQSSLRVHLSQGQANADSFGARMFLVFKNQQLQYVRKVVDAYVQFKNGEISQSKFAKTAFIYLILNPMVYTALTQGWFAADDDDREEDLKNLLTSPVSQFFGAYPFGEGVAGFFVDNAASLVSEGKLTAPRQMGLPMFDDITRDVAKAVKTVNADEVDTMEFINVFLAAAKYTGLPTQSVMNMGGGLVDIVTGKPVRGSLRAVGYTQNRAGKITGDKE